jgi:hypothetical protein
VERWWRDCRINQIVEGTNDILRLFVAREGLDRHLDIVGDILRANTPAPKKLRALLSATAFYSYWYPRQWLPIPPWKYLGSPLRPVLRYIDRTSRRLARATFHCMIRNGPRLEKRQLQLGRLVDIASDLFALSAAVWRSQNTRDPEHRDLTRLLFHEVRNRIENSFRLLRRNADPTIRKISERMLP